MKTFNLIPYMVLENDQRAKLPSILLVYCLSYAYFEDDKINTSVTLARAISRFLDYTEVEITKAWKTLISNGDIKPLSKDEVQIGEISNGIKNIFFNTSSRKPEKESPTKKVEDVRDLSSLVSSIRAYKSPLGAAYKNQEVEIAKAGNILLAGQYEATNKDIQNFWKNSYRITQGVNAPFLQAKDNGQLASLLKGHPFGEVFQMIWEFSSNFKKYSKGSYGLGISGLLHFKDAVYLEVNKSAATKILPLDEQPF